MKTFVRALTVCSIALAACTGDGGVTEPVATTEVTGTVANVFDPKVISISAGDTVTWTWEGLHDVTADDASFVSGEAVLDSSFEHQFDVVGTFKYYCSVHGTAGGIGMSGTVIVA